jgi:hypothetical protein
MAKKWEALGYDVDDWKLNAFVGPEDVNLDNTGIAPLIIGFEPASANDIIKPFSGLSSAASIGIQGNSLQDPANSGGSDLALDNFSTGPTAATTVPGISVTPLSDTDALSEGSSVILGAAALATGHVDPSVSGNSAIANSAEPMQAAGQLTGANDRSTSLAPVIGSEPIPSAGVPTENLAATDINFSFFLDGSAASPDVTGTTDVPNFGPVEQVEGASSNGTNYDAIDQAVFGDQARAEFGVTGAGVKIGIISDSFDQLDGGQDYQMAVAAGLAASGAVYTGPHGLDSDTTGEDEGLAMAEIVHEIAPNAQIYFYTAAPGGASAASSIATAINTLASDGCNVICDDYDAPNEPFYEEGGTTDTAINNAVADGITYVTCAINPGAQSFYEGNFLSSSFSTTIPDENGTFTAYDFGAAGSPSAFDTVTVPTAMRNLTLQWDQPFLTSEGYASGNGSGYSLDFVLYNSTETTVEAVGEDFSGGTDAVGLDPVQNASGVAAGTYELAIVEDGGSIPAGQGEFKIIGDDNSDNPVTFAGGDIGSGSIWGHNEDPEAITVGAAPYTDTPAFGGTFQMEQFSASGPGEFLVGPTGTQLATPVSSGKVNITGPDGGFTSDPDISQFYGTSAATPSVAAVVALMLQEDPNLTPAEVEKLLDESAINEGNPNVSGAGLVDALTAVADASPPPPPPTTPPPSTPPGTTCDMVLQDTSGGNLELYDLGSNSVLAAYPMGDVGLNWLVLGFGDFGGNSDEADMLMRDSNTGNLEYYDIRASQIVSAGSIGNIGLAWQVLGFGDFSGNANETDMIMRDTNNGNLQYFDIQDNEIVSAGLIGNIGLDWQMLGVGDFSGNPNESDLLMRDTSNGNLEYLDVQDNQIVGTGPIGNIGLEWQALGVGDFSGNPNESDLLMRDTNNGNLLYLDIQDNQVVAAGSMGNIGVNWQVAGFADISGNPNESDMIMRDSNTGNFDYFDIQHNEVVKAGSLGNVGLAWQTLGVAGPLVLGSQLL